MFSMFTKLKSDFYIKIEALGQDQLKTANKVKELFKVTETTTNYLSDAN